MTDVPSLPPLPQDPPRVPTRSFATGRAIMALILREMATSYGRNPGGYLWAVLQPAGSVMIISILFSLIARTPALGTNFPIFFATGLVPFGMYRLLSAKVGAALTFSKSLLMYPSVTFVDALIARFALTVLTQLMVGYVVFSAILLIFETRTAIDLPAIALSFAMAAAVGGGMGVLNCFIIGVLPMWKQIWAMFNRPLIILSCIFYIFENVPQPYRDWLWYNPLVHVVGQMRHGFYPYYDATYVSPVYVFAVSLTAMVLGLLLLRRYAVEILNS